jgi:hypothetical protein
MRTTRTSRPDDRSLLGCDRETLAELPTDDFTFH